MEADDVTCVAMAEALIDMQNGNMCCLMGRDVIEYDYVSVGKDEFIPIGMKPMASATQLVNDMV
jgi:hypothetical protein